MSFYHDKAREREEVEQSSDKIDQGSATGELFTRIAIAAHAAKVKPEQVRNPDGTWPITECVDCDDEIPIERLNLGKVRCVFCQSRKELVYAK